jgi:hemerythrin-like domain-containing protein
MKRHPALAPLSRDHHHALVLAQRLRRAGEQEAADTAVAFLEHWTEVERLHFRLEEEVLLPAYAAYGDPDHPAVARTLLDHMRIRRDVDRLAAAVDLELLHELGARLADHVRLEENELFPLVERTLLEPALAALGERLADREAPQSASEASVPVLSTPGQK